MMKLSGKFVLRMHPALHEKLITHAQKTALSLNETCLELINQGLENQKLTPLWKKKIVHFIPKLKEKFQSHLVGITLFGSQISGEATLSSDVDVLIVLDKKIPLTRNLYTWWDTHAPKNFGTQVNPHFVHKPNHLQDAGSLWFEVALNHEILFQKNKVLESIFTFLNQAIGENKITRAWSNGHPYWIWGEQ